MVTRLQGTITGLFDLARRGGGYLRLAEEGYRENSTDIVVPGDLCRDLHLRGGEMIEGTVGNSSARHRRHVLELQEVSSINGRPVGDHLSSVPFEELTATTPTRQIHLETESGPLATRIVDHFVPVGFGQRGIIVAPPRTGKTILLQQIAHGAAANHPDLYIMLLLIDERPEEVTDMQRNVPGDVVASSNDRVAAEHVRLSRLMLAKAKRMVEVGRDVLILLDSLTRLARAFNTETAGNGRTLSGGMDQAALDAAKSIFGAARNTEEAGSLTIIASALVGTESRMDDVIFSEFKGAGNMELVLSRDLADLRMWPAIDITQSGTRKEELLLSERDLRATRSIRRSIDGKGPAAAMEVIRERLS